LLGKRFATRINSFASNSQDYWPDLNGKPSLVQMVARASTVEGLSELDLNYPDHVGADALEVARVVRDTGLSVSGLAMRYYTNPAFKRGAFTNADPVVRREAIDLTKRGIDAAREMGAPMMTLWLGQDGYEPRAYSLLNDASTTLLAIAEVGAANLGVTIDFAHSLYADEQPAFAAALIVRKSKLLGLHLNDGYAKRDDGLMVASVHEFATLELLREVHRAGFDGAIYFDTFPDASGLDPVAECAANIRTVRRLLAAVEAMAGDNSLADAQSRQDPVVAQNIARLAAAKGALTG
jgi:sugar phosphate isomerase/epimerase